MTLLTFSNLKIDSEVKTIDVVLVSFSRAFERRFCYSVESLEAELEGGMAVNCLRSHDMIGGGGRHGEV